jgi:hypothetical protein
MDLAVAGLRERLAGWEPERLDREHRPRGFVRVDHDHRRSAKEDARLDHSWTPEHSDIACSGFPAPERCRFYAPVLPTVCQTESLAARDRRYAAEMYQP